MNELTEQLGVVFSSVIPELENWRFGSESFATCSSCPMQPQPGQVLPEHRPVFTAKARCCTYHPDLPNFLAGRALKRGGVGAEKIRARLENPEVRYATGIVRPAEVAEQYLEFGKTSFGNREDLTCPYWVSGKHNCSIYADRNAVCRTWHCKSVDGAKGHAAWTALRWLLLEVESELSKIAITTEAPSRETSVETWVEWYIACAKRVEDLNAETLKTLRTPRLEQLIIEVARAVTVRDAHLPEVLAPSIATWFVEPDGVAMTAWSGYDLVDAPSWIFELLSRMDGTKSWREAKFQTEAAIGTAISDDLIHTLHRRGLLSAPESMPESGAKWRFNEAPGIGDEDSFKEMAEHFAKALTEDENLE
jgi:Fe-S-cluster containining protein